MPKGVRVELKNLNYEPTRAQIDDLARRYNLTPEQVQTILNAVDNATPKAANAKDALNDFTSGNWEVILDANGDPVLQKVSSLESWIDSLTGTLDVDGNPKPGKGKTNSLLDYINNQTGTVGVGANTSAARAAVRAFKNSIGSAVIPLLPFVRREEGGVVDYFASGAENHVAQIAPAGAWRVWAEPETGGEAYIPLAASKRQRSLEIWNQTGSRLGVEGYANGGVTGSGSPGVGKMDYRDLERAVFAGIDGATLTLRADGRSFQIKTKNG